MAVLTWHDIPPAVRLPQTPAGARSPPRAPRLPCLRVLTGRQLRRSLPSKARAAPLVPSPSTPSDPDGRLSCPSAPARVPVAFRRSSRNSVPTREVPMNCAGQSAASTRETHVRSLARGKPGVQIPSPPPQNTTSKAIALGRWDCAFGARGGIRTLDLPTTRRPLTLGLDPSRTIVAAQERDRFHSVPSCSAW
jgi:hypothetical protein